LEKGSGPGFSFSWAGKGSGLGFSFSWAGLEPLNQPWACQVRVDGFFFRKNFIVADSQFGNSWAHRSGPTVQGPCPVRGGHRSPDGWWFMVDDFRENPFKFIF
jgi:hypothetical protein